MGGLTFARPLPPQDKTETLLRQAPLETFHPSVLAARETPRLQSRSRNVCKILNNVHNLQCFFLFGGVGLNPH
jgi:hypothetical protein